MLRQGFVSNSSSTSFVIALRKGYTWEHAIKDAGPFTVFAQALADYAGTMQSIQNIELAFAREDLTSSSHISEETVVKWVKEGEYDFVREACEDTVEDPQAWVFVYGYASYNDGEGPVEAWLSYGGEIDAENVKVKRVPQ